MRKAAITLPEIVNTNLEIERMHAANFAAAKQAARNSREARAFQTALETAIYTGVYTLTMNKADLTGILAVTGTGAVMGVVQGFVTADGLGFSCDGVKCAAYAAGLEDLVEARVKAGAAARLSMNSDAHDCAAQS